ncbi:hypothetical protein DPMN_007618 [Dreissena polymorpha]|uniref:Uncharacterized protein n=1 Tax=Dreissena polymorpha TaxID=45954 RepID=A0A9D4MWJ0_DREPO|nr:hypothetical protein DPMN_007618 [Dreissena polymorpha]
MTNRALLALLASLSILALENQVIEEKSELNAVILLLLKPRKSDRTYLLLLFSPGFSMYCALYPTVVRDARTNISLQDFIDDDG